MNELIQVRDSMLPSIALRIGRFAMVMLDSETIKMGLIPRRLYAKRKEYLEGPQHQLPISPLNVAKMMLSCTRPDLLPKQFSLVLDFIEERESDVWCRYRIRDVRTMLRNMGTPTFGKTREQSDRHRYLAILSLVPRTATPEEARLRCFRKVPKNAHGMRLCLLHIGLPDHLAIFVLTFV